MHHLLPFVLLTLLTTLSFAPADAPTTLYRSNDGGLSWEPFGHGLPEGTLPNEVLEHDCDLYISTRSGGIFRLGDGEERWEAAGRGIPGKLGILSLAADGNFMIFGTSENGVFFSRDGGRNWQHSTFNPTGGAVHSLLFLDGRLIAGTERGIFHSWDQGFSWMRSGPAMPINDLARHRGKLYAARPDGIAVSEDGGDSWRRDYSGGEVWKLQVTGAHVHGLFPGADRLTVRSLDGREWTDGQVAWQQRLPRLPDDLRVRNVVPTSRGWIAGLNPGC